MEMKLQEMGMALVEELLCKLAESANVENKKKIDKLENELKSVQEKLKDMEARLEAALRKKSSVDGLCKDDDDECLINVEKVVGRAMVNKWVLPPEGYLKLNVEALNSSTDYIRSPASDTKPCVGVGAVIRDHKGDIYRFMYCKLSVNLSGIMLKVIALREGLSWVETLSLTGMGLIVETDCLVLAGLLASVREDFSDYGLAVMECRALLRSFDMDIIVKQVKREANFLARRLAIHGRHSLYSKYMLRGQNPKYFSDAPSDLECIVDSERPVEFKNNK